MLPALKLSQHWRGSEHTPVCKAARDTWPMPLPGSQQCSLAAGSLPGLFSRLCPETQSSQKPAGAMLRQGARQGVFSERAVRCSGGGPQDTAHRPLPLDRGEGARKAAPPRTLLRWAAGRVLPGTVFSGLDLRTAGAHRAGGERTECR